MLTLQSPKRKEKGTLAIAYKNSFALDNRTKSNKTQTGNPKHDNKEKSTWRKNLKKVPYSGRGEKLTSNDCVYEQSSMFLFAIPK